MPWPAWLTPSEVRFDKTPLWVNIESIPPFYWNLSNLKELASKFSPVHELPLGIKDDVGLSTLRFRATIDLNKPIFSGFFLRRQKLKDLWIQNRYEQLPKLCFKCGILTHDQSVCFKAPTVIKDDKGTFYPMFGTWLKHESKERSTFTSPLAKWFQDWALQKPLDHDPKAILHGDSDELRECRLQLSAKKRIASEDDESNSWLDQPEAVITQIPLVRLPGIGEIAPFDNWGDPLLCTSKSKVICGPSSEPSVDPKDNSIPYSCYILGTQAHLMDWPSTQCWTEPQARELLMGSLTVDKFFREPTLFNPVLDIEDFRVEEHLHGRRKRKALDGLAFCPSFKARNSCPNLTVLKKDLNKFLYHMNNVGPFQKTNKNK
ncbi:hypothetical protein G4B88_023954 [Cannabis sativa]|uniref:Zinc knuckle CX2CX4HX4C domain-containing protein n=1 Tax=Cannabis sativa TaxID=3483 RepID=A0A7J6GM03_CANSA|nr:hypothetical protein G4B88_023954 [Cannabis sativa]